MSAGPHIVTKRWRASPVRYYVYAWRGGPMVFSKEGGAKPKITPEIMALVTAARAERGMTGADRPTIGGLIVAYKSSPEWNNLSPSTRPTWSIWLDRIAAKFGKAPLAAFEDRRVRGDILGWRDNWAAQPRSADMAIQVLSRLLSWGVDRGRLTHNYASGVAHLYDSDRSDIIWEDKHFEAFKAHASVEVMEAVELAACTGLRRTELAAIPWAAVGDHAIIWQTSKSRGKNRIVIPLLPETRMLLAKIKDRHAAFMEKQRPSRRKELPATILSNSYWRPWTAMGLGSRFNDAKQASGIDVNLHDLRGTFATRCMIAGLTDQEIADIVGWATKDIAAIRIKYVDKARVVVAIAKRLSAGGL